MGQDLPDRDVLVALVVVIVCCDDAPGLPLGEGRPELSGHLGCHLLPSVRAVEVVPRGAALDEGVIGGLAEIDSYAVFQIGVVRDAELSSEFGSNDLKILTAL